MSSIFSSITDVPVDNLGPATIPSLLPYNLMKADEDVQLCLDSEHAEEITTPKQFTFQLAGPRSSLYFDTSKTRCAIVTCGGLCPGLNDVIRSIVIAAHYEYGIPSILGIRYGLEGFIPKYNHSFIDLTPQNTEHIHQFGGTMLGSSRGPQDPAAIVDALRRMHVNILFVIGGDGSMKAAEAIVQSITSQNLPISVIGIPKTIDNDINFIPKSFGFDTAVDKATEAISCAHVEAVGTCGGIGLVKLMGRESGFISAQASLACRESNFVLVPETNFDLHGERGLLVALARRLKTRKHAVIVTAEGAGQHLMTESCKADPSGNLILGDIGSLLKHEISTYLRAENIPHNLKYIDPSYIIRSVPANANDRVYCGFLGQQAVHAGMAGKTSMVIAKIMDRYVHVPLHLVTSKRRRMSINSSLWRAVLEATGQGRVQGMLPDSIK